MRVVLHGLGRVGSGVARLLVERGHSIAGAICRRPETEGRDVGEIAGIGVLGVLASRDADEILASARADVAVHATDPRLAVVEPELTQLLEAGLDVLTLTEEAAYPWGSHPEAASRLDAVAREHDVSVLATGINPGFIWDTLVGAFSLGSRSISKIQIRRQTTLSFLSEQTLAQMGVGLSAADFAAAVASGEVMGHVGTRQSLELVGASFGWELESFEESLTGLEGDDGLVCGFRQRAEARFHSGSIEVDLQPRLGLEETFDEVALSGSPDRRLRIAPAMEPMSTARAVAVNVLPAVAVAEPGLRTMLDLPFPSARLAGSRAGVAA